MSRSTKRQARTGLSFLYIRAAEDAASRLEDINRRFARAVLVGRIDGREFIISNLRPDRRPEDFEYLQAASNLDGEYDVILSLFDLQSDDDIPATLMRYRKHLAPDGLLLIAFLAEKH